MKRAAVIGAGSIGNHLTYSARKFDWKISVFDQDPVALRRFKEDIYPSRYGKFDSEIELFESDAISKFGVGDFDVILVGTPPDSHLSILTQMVKLAPRVLLIEKPICPPIESDIFSTKEIFEGNPGTTFLSGYNHRLSLVTQQLLNSVQLRDEYFQRLRVEWLESWDGILKAHPWIDGPGDTYLGSTKRGGGALFEHSHGLDLWIQIANYLRLGKPSSVRANLRTKAIDKVNAEYDEVAILNIRTETGFEGEVLQDVITSPASKRVSLGSNRFDYECQYGQAGLDSWRSTPLDNSIGEIVVEVKKHRPNDFDPEIAFINRKLTRANSCNTPLGLGAMSALITAFVGKCAIESSKQSKEISIDLSDWKDLENA